MEKTMLDHVSIGVRDANAAKHFYDAALKPLGYSCLSQSPGSLGYGGETVALWVNRSSDGRWRQMRSPACISASPRQRVQASMRFTRRRSAKVAATMARPACAPTMATNYYAAFVIDPDGYRIEAYCSAAG